ncbi:MAG TPA: DUF930 domain-containing protein, partial [Afipia sp.]
MGEALIPPLVNGGVVKYAPAILAFALLVLIRPSWAVDARFYASLNRLDPATRLEQVCDLEAMSQIDRDANPYHPDRAKTDVISSPKHTGDTV